MDIAAATHDWTIWNGSEKMYYSLIKPMLSKNVISKQAQIRLKEFIFFCNAFPSVLLKYFTFQDVLCPKGLPQWGIGLHVIAMFLCLGCCCLFVDATSLCNSWSSATRQERVHNKNWIWHLCNYIILYNMAMRSHSPSEHGFYM